jgi:signal transduction histidine kinase
MGGDIELHSEEGKGSQFTFKLPVASEPVSDEGRPRV